MAAVKLKARNRNGRILIKSRTMRIICSILTDKKGQVIHSSRSVVSPEKPDICRMDGTSVRDRWFHHRSSMSCNLESSPLFKKTSRFEIWPRARWLDRGSKWIDRQQSPNQSTLEQYAVIDDALQELNAILLKAEPLLKRVQHAKIHGQSSRKRDVHHFSSWIQVIRHW
jgi:hypothetical protein